MKVHEQNYQKQLILEKTEKYYTFRVATETAKSNSRTFLDHFPGLLQYCLRFFTGLKI